MKKKKPVYVYLNQELIGRFESCKEASERTNVSPCTVANIVNGKAKTPVTRQGYHFSYKKLTDEEREELPIMDTVKKTGYTRVDGRACRQIVEDAVYEVACKNPLVCHLQRSKIDRIEEFKTFLFTKFRERWLLIPKQVATLERQYIRESLNSFL